MTYNKKVEKIYIKLLGEALTKQLTKTHILQNQFGFQDADGKDVSISATTVEEILKGRRNMTSRSALAFQETLQYQTPKVLFLQDDSFKIELLSQLILIILADSTFDNTLFKKSLIQKINKYTKKGIHDFVKKHKDVLIDSLSNFFPDFPEEESSYKIAEKLTIWLFDFACLIEKF